MNSSIAIWAVTIASIGLLFTPAQAQFVVFSDSFDRTNGSGDGNGLPLGDGNGISDWGMNDNAMGGSAVQTYTFGQGRAGGANQTTDGTSAQIIAGAAQIEFDFATVAPTGFEVEFDFTRVANADATTPNPVGFLALAIGVDDTDQIENQEGFNGNTFVFTNPDNGADAAVLIRQNNNDANTGSVEFFSAGVQDLVAEPFYNNPHDTMHSAKITVDAPNGYGAGESGTLSLSIDGGTGFSNPFTFDGVSSGYLSLYSNLAGTAESPRFAQLDNLVVTAFGDPPVGPAGDFSGDGMVDGEDLSLLLGFWGTGVPPTPAGWNGAPPTSPAIDADELSALLGTWGQSSAAVVEGNAVPEPATAVVLVSGLVVASGIFRRRLGRIS